MARTPEHKVYEMREALKESGWVEGVSGWTRYDHSDRHVEAAKARGNKEARESGRSEGRNELARSVISAFGLAESYPDTTEEGTGRRPVYNPSDYYWSLYRHQRYETYTYEVTISGTVAFIADLKAVADSRDVAEAQKRLGLAKK